MYVDCRTKCLDENCEYFAWAYNLRIDKKCIPFILECLLYSYVQDGKLFYGEEACKYSFYLN